MVRQIGQVSYNTFVKGLITEAGPLTFPDNATIEDMNCVLTLKGSHRRRYGISEEQDGQPLFTEGLSSLNLKEDNVFSYVWQDAANSTKDFLIVLIGSSLKIYEINQESSFVNKEKASLSISHFLVTSLSNRTVSLTSVKGFLFCTISGYEPFSIEYNKEQDTFFTKALVLKIRDLKGVEDGLAVDENPATLSDEHEYNLLNQGWFYQKNIIAAEEVDEGVAVQVSAKAAAYATTNGASRIYCYKMQVWVNGTKQYEGSLSPQGEGWLTAFNRLSEDLRGSTYLRDIGGSQIVKIGSSTIAITLSWFITRGSPFTTLIETEEEENYFWSTPNSQISIDVTNTNSPIGAYFRHFSLYPSNAQQWFVAKNATGELDENILEDFVFGNTPAAKGHFILNAFTENRLDVFGKADSFPKKNDINRCSSCASSNGHIFYALDDKILFSQIVDDISKAEKCYQDGDPASETTFDLLDTDGGTVEIPGVSKTLKLVELSNGVCLLSDSGIWTIGGISSDEAFKATSFSVKKVCSFDCVSSKSCVIHNDAIFFWSSSGIYVVSPNEYGLLTATSLSENTIQRLYAEIPKHNKQHALGVYDHGCQKIYWLYDITTKENVVPNRYTRGIVFDIRLQAFYEMSFSSSDSGPFICAAFNIPWLEKVNFNQEVFDEENEIVYDNEGMIVFTKKENPNSPLTDVKFLAYTIEPDSETTEEYFKVTVCSFNDSSFTDWATSTREGIPYESYFTTGYNIAGESDSKKDIIYLTTQLSRTEDAYDETSLANRSSCQMQIRWDYENNSYSGKWTKPVQIYRANRLFAPTLEDPNYDHRGLPVVTTKHKVRGNGRAIQIKFTSEPGKNFEVLGWSMILGNRK